MWEIEISNFSINLDACQPAHPFRSSAKSDGHTSTLPPGSEIPHP